MSNTTDSANAATAALPLAPCSVAARNHIGCINVEDCEGAGDNLAIALATYFSDHHERPSDDKDDTEFGWGEWVIAKTNRALERIVEATSPNNPDQTPRGTDK